MIILISEVFEDFILLSLSAVVVSIVCLFVYLCIYLLLFTVKQLISLEFYLEEVLRLQLKVSSSIRDFIFPSVNSLTNWKPS